MKTAEEILQKHMNNPNYSMSDIEKNKDILSAMQEYAEQYHKAMMPSDMEIATEIVARFLHNPHPNQKANYQREKKAFADGAVFAKNYINQEK